MKIKYFFLLISCGGLFYKLVEMVQKSRPVPGFGGEFLLIPLILLIWYFAKDIRVSIERFHKNFVETEMSEEEYKPDNPERDRAA